jgi:hypothetical protein
MEQNPMRKKTQKHKSKPADTLLKTRDIELTEKELGQVTGGDKKATKATLMQLCAGGTHLPDATIT